MAKRILVVDNDPGEINARKRAQYGETTGEGYAAALKAVDPACDVAIAAPYDGDALPLLSELDGVVFTGSAVDWTTEDPLAAALAEAMRRVFAAGVPTLGSCNGFQLAASVLGGATAPSPNGREDGLALGIRLTDAGRTHPLLAGRNDGYAAPCVHRDEVVRVPQGAVVLAANSHSPVQAMVYERDGVRFWGMQYHPEYSLKFIGARVRDWDLFPDDKAADLTVADEDPDAAARLGVRFADMQPEMRMTEIRNWLRSL
ncbi:type 1 glutamine amidotransferase [uncultured Roseobacter sp.]|uniref:type 1 glutamine amidotransferase n=1 Tax=uncultured Roseobacter sp. TaxID=114847 RepID=UPI002615ED52|nr:type 1 glutamine amidotransferase [uncultured Roseobacter sp.]